MAVRLVVSITAAPGKGAEFAQAFRPRCEQSRKDPGCQQFDIFQSVSNPDKFALLECRRACAPAPASVRITNTS